MNKNDFSTPRRMSKSAFVIYFIRAFKSQVSFFFLVFLLRFSDIVNKDSLVDALLKLVTLLGICVGLSLLFSFVQYYFKKFYIQDGHLVYIRGLFSKENLSIPLSKIQTTRTKQSFLYRIFDMKCISFDTLASQHEEVELILDLEDWEVLLGRSMGDTVEENISIPRNLAQEWGISHWNLLKGAFCQNHLRGMGMLMVILGTLFNQLNSVNDQLVTNVVVGYFDDWEQYLGDSWWNVTIFLVKLYLVVMLLWIGRVFFRYFNTTLSIEKNQLFFESGLVTRYSSQFSCNKVSTIDVKQNILEKWWGISTLMLKQAFNATDEKKGSDVVLYGSHAASRFLCWWLGDTYASSPVVTIARSGYGVMWHVIQWEVLMALGAMGVLCFYQQYLWVVAVILFLVLSLFKGWLAVRRSFLVLKDDYFEVHTGRFATITHYVKYANLEVVQLVGTPCTAYSHRVKLVMATNGTMLTIRSLKEEEARAIYEYLLKKSA